MTLRHPVMNMCHVVTFPVLQVIARSSSYLIQQLTEMCKSHTGSVSEACQYSSSLCFTDLLNRICPQSDVVYMMCTCTCPVYIIYPSFTSSCTAIHSAVFVGLCLLIHTAYLNSLTPLRNMTLISRKNEMRMCAKVSRQTRGQFIGEKCGDVVSSS